MWSRQDRERDLRALLTKIEAACEPRKDLVTQILDEACPRLQSSGRLYEGVERLLAAQAWIDLGTWLVGWELPDWRLHRLSCDDSRWNCLITLRGLALNWVEDVVEYQHDNLALAIFGAFVEAQLLRVKEPASSNVISFRKTGPDDDAPGTKTQPND